MFRNQPSGRLGAEAVRAIRDEANNLRSRADELERAVVAAGVEPPQAGTMESGPEAKQALMAASDSTTLPQLLAELRALRVAVDRIGQQAAVQGSSVQVVDDIGDWPQGGGGAPQGWQQVTVDVAGIPQGFTAWDPWDPLRAGQGPFIALVPTNDRLSVTTGTRATEIAVSGLYPPVPATSATPTGMCYPEGEQRTATRTSVSGRTLFMRTGTDLLQLVGVVTYQLFTDRWLCRDDPGSVFGLNSWQLDGLQASTTEIRRRMTILSL